MADVWEALRDLKAAEEAHSQAFEALELARLERAFAVDRAVRAGAGVRRVGRMLGISHVRVLQLLRELEGQAAAD
ncbi:MAG: hypothetical protein ABR532_01555 [Candidatus Dormibacteria bacterium]